MKEHSIEYWILVARALRVGTAPLPEVDDPRLATEPDFDPPGTQPGSVARAEVNGLWIGGAVEVPTAVRTVAAVGAGS